MTARKSKAAKPAAPPEAAPEVVTAFKALDSDFKCRGFAFAVGKTYTHDGAVVMCESGFHGVLNPMDAWRYYDLIDGNGNLTRYAVVEQSGDIKRHDEDTKIASATITIKAELKLAKFITDAVKWVIESCKGSDERVLASSGHSAQLASSGDFAQLASSGDFARLASSGDFARLASSGHSARLASSGHFAQLASSGHSARLASSGDFARLASSGYRAQLASSGHSARLASSGNFAQLASSGHSARLASSGENSVIASSSYNAAAKGALGTWIAMAEFDDSGKCVGFATGCIGKDGLKPDVLYRAQGGKLVEAA